MPELLRYPDADANDTVIVWCIDRLGRSSSTSSKPTSFCAAVGSARDRALTASTRDVSGPARAAHDRHPPIVERVNASIAAATESGTRLGRPPVNPDIIAEKLAIVSEARSRGRTATEAAALVGWIRATLYRHKTGTTGGTATP